ncbi:DoxX [Novipirellula aureliae]|uniref:DoxX n=1 Tax=Novipirellula aureliae TaxID=2527966 RepID=A0A5C6E2L6_9BACT|nr:DoxX family protein [Novipirellula aureliae]TWU43893.1 DoxX [Novipirellula aureliae]
MLTWKNASQAKLEDYGKLLLRVTIAGLMLFHGIAKMIGGVGGIEGMLAAKGVPTLLAYGVYVGELVVPLLMLAGVFTRISSLVFAFNMLVAILLAHSADILSIGPHGGWAIELPMLYLLGSLVIALIGPGNYAVRQGKGWWL